MPKRVRNRYIEIEVDSDEQVDNRSVFNTVWSSILRFFGEYGASQAGLTVIEYDSRTKLAIIRCSHRELEMVKASIAAVTEIQNRRATMHVLRVSGTLKSLRKKMPS